jgi:hypothetical protein
MWRHLTTISVGGLENLGFSRSGNIIVLSSQGRGILDAATGQKIFRDDKDWWQDFISDERAIAGFGGEKDAMIKLSGLHTQDYLAKKTSDGWLLYAEDSFHGSMPIKRFFLTHSGSSASKFIVEDGPCEVRCYGFSDDERLMVIATSCELVIWIRVTSYAGTI